MFHPTNRDSHMKLYEYIITTNHTSIYLKCPIYVGMLPICLDGPCIFGWSPYASLYVWTPPYLWMPLHVWCPPCLDAPYAVVPHMFRCPPYVWMPPIHAQHKESMLYPTKGVSICPNTFGCHLYINNKK